MKNLLIALCLCLGLSVATAKKEAEFVKNWKLKTMNGVDVKSDCSMKITPNGTFVGKGFCNNFTGNLAFDGKKKVTCNQNIASTKKMCAEHMDAENEFFNTLKKVDAYEIDDDLLYFKSEKQIVLVFERIIEPKKTKKELKAEAEEAKRKAEEEKLKAEQAVKEAKKQGKGNKKGK